MPLHSDLGTPVEQIKGPMAYSLMVLGEIQDNVRIEKYRKIVGKQVCFSYVESTLAYTGVEAD